MVYKREKGEPAGNRTRPYSRQEGVVGYTALPESAQHRDGPMDNADDVLYFFCLYGGSDRIQ